MEGREVFFCYGRNNSKYLNFILIVIILMHGWRMLRGYGDSPACTVNLNGREVQDMGQVEGAQNMT